jgi:hypothetical protein
VGGVTKQSQALHIGLAPIMELRIHSPLTMVALGRESRLSVGVTARTIFVNARSMPAQGMMRRDGPYYRPRDGKVTRGPLALVNGWEPVVEGVARMIVASEVPGESIRLGKIREHGRQPQPLHLNIHLFNLGACFSLATFGWLFDQLIENGFG